jgi:hypothetical protein
MHTHAHTHTHIAIMNLASKANFWQAMQTVRWKIIFISNANSPAV